jgi:hypothetical protein
MKVVVIVYFTVAILALFVLGGRLRTHHHRTSLHGVETLLGIPPKP